MTDFGLRERFVASMKGVALGVDPGLGIYDLTHQVEPFNIGEAAFTLANTIEFWPRGSVFVAVVDPGVGTERSSVAAKTRSGHIVVTPDNGTLTWVQENLGILEVRRIDADLHMRPGSENFHTFHGRDLYVYAGAKLASGSVSFNQIGPVYKQELITMPHEQPQKIGDRIFLGQVARIEGPFGNVVTNIPKEMFLEIGQSQIETSAWRVEIFHLNRIVFQGTLPFVASFGMVEEGRVLAYFDSMGMVGLAKNAGNFAEDRKVESGMGWSIKITILSVPISKGLE